MKKSTLVLLSIGAMCLVAGGRYAIQNTSSTNDSGLFSTQSVRSQCIVNEKEYISCRKEGYSEKFCLIKQSKERNTGKTCLEKIPAYSKPVTFTSPVEDEYEIYTDRITIMLSEKNTGRKSIVTDYNSEDQTAVEYANNGLRNETTPYQTKLMNYLNIALDAYGIKEMHNNSSYFATKDDNINPNIIYIVFTKETDIGTFIAELQSKIDQTIDVLPEYKKTSYEVPNDPQASSVWYLQGGNGVNAYKARDQLSGTILGSVQVGIVDDGFYVQHEDLSIASASPEGVGGGHGTHVAGLVGALTNNEKGVPSAARNTGNIVIKGYNYHFSRLDNDGSNNIMGLVQQAVQDGAKVMNMSRGGGGYSSADAQIFQAAYNLGVVLIAAAGNEGASQPGYPARYPGVISVSASDLNGNKAGFSNAGGDLLSPGVNIKSTCIGGGYCNRSGTSIASPLAASVAALLLSINPGLTPSQIESILKSTVNAKGVINECNAVAKLLGNDPAVVCGDDENTGGGLGDDCLGDTECTSGSCEEIIKGECVSGKYGEKIACKGFTTEEQCLGFKQEVGTGSMGTGSNGGNSGGNLISVCEWKETVVGGTCVGNCGNGILEGINGNNEQCDDGNNTNGDGCDSMCKIEGCASDSECSEGYCKGYLAQGCYQVPDPKSGNQEPDPKSGIDGDNICTNLSKDICNKSADCKWFDEYKGSCKVPVCGDGELDPAEECELNKGGNMGGGSSAGNDGNINGDTDGLSTTAGGTTSWECIECKKVYKEIQPICGNNTLEEGEQCDGSGCAKGQTCAPAGSKNACTCQTEIIKEPIPSNPTKGNDMLIK